MLQARSIIGAFALFFLYSQGLLAGSRYSAGLGHGAWVFDSPSNTFAHVKAYSRHVPRKGMPLNLLLVDVGNLKNLNISNAVETASLMLPSTQVYARIHVGDAISQAEDLNWDALASACLKPIQEHDALRGLLLDADESGPGFAALANAFLNQMTNRVLAVAAPQIDPILLETCGLVILKGFNLANSPRKFRRQLSPLLDEFLEQSRKHETSWMLGIPSSATELEFESKKLPDGTLQESGYSMADYVRSALRQLEKHCPDLGENYRGLCLWAYAPKGAAAALPTTPNKLIYRIINFPPCR